MGARADAAVIVQVFADDSYQGTADLRQCQTITERI